MPIDWRCGGSVVAVVVVDPFAAAAPVGARTEAVGTGPVETAGGRCPRRRPRPSASASGTTANPPCPGRLAFASVRLEPDWALPWVGAEGRRGLLSRSSASAPGQDARVMRVGSVACLPDAESVRPLPNPAAPALATAEDSGWLMRAASDIPPRDGAAGGAGWYASTDVSIVEAVDASDSRGDSRVRGRLEGRGSGELCRRLGEAEDARRLADESLSPLCSHQHVIGCETEKSEATYTEWRPPDMRSLRRKNNRDGGG